METRRGPPPLSLPLESLRPASRDPHTRPLPEYAGLRSQPHAHAPVGVALGGSAECHAPESAGLARAQLARDPALVARLRAPLDVPSLPRHRPLGAYGGR